MSSPLPVAWGQYLDDEFETSYMQALKAYLRQQKDERRVVYPASENWFRAFELTPLDQVRVVILGQDPYHGPGQAHGLCFSVHPGVAIPPSLLNIYKELEADDVEFTAVNHGFLENWARQGVLLLNSVLTVERGQAAAHRGQGWEQFTDRAIATVNEQCPHVVFMLWGSYAQKKASFVDRQRHLVLHAPHPSPLSAHRGFFGCHHFSRANVFLQEHGITPIDWRLPEQPGG